MGTEHRKVLRFFVSNLAFYATKKVFLNAYFCMKSDDFMALISSRNGVKKRIVFRLHFDFKNRSNQLKTNPFFKS